MSEDYDFARDFPSDLGLPPTEAEVIRYWKEECARLRALVETLKADNDRLANRKRDKASIKPELTPRFWAQVNKIEGGCWEWTGVVDRGGYGELGYKGFKYKAHRFSWAATNGPAPAGMILCHKCNNRLCVNPEHLYVGTYQSNSDDKMNADRGPRGVKHPGAKFTEAQVLAIYWSDKPYAELAAEHNCIPQMIGRIKLKKSWRCLTEKLAPPPMNRIYRRRSYSTLGAQSSKEPT
jgi:hypothetical protein